MNLQLNEKQVSDAGLTMGEALYLASVYFNSTLNFQVIDNVCTKGFLEYKGFDRQRYPVDCTLTPDGISIVESLFLNSEFKQNSLSDDRYDVLAEELRNLFPKGKKPGTQLMWKDSKAIISKRLRALVKKYKLSFTNDEAIAATQKYIDSFNGNTTYMQVLKYFLSKQVLVEGAYEEQSQFLSYLDNSEDIEHGNDEWNIQLR